MHFFEIQLALLKSIPDTDGQLYVPNRLEIYLREKGLLRTLFSCS